eukprot:GSChrysophyteH1.ASY1.ANO1.456.1 assembled CDS
MLQLIGELTAFIAAQWLMGRLFRFFGGPSILAEMITGIILGPEVLNFVPYAIEDPITKAPSILALVGNVGVALMIFESGMHLNFDKVKVVGNKAFVIACIVGFDIFPDSMAIGIALAPTSVGISLKMLGEAKFLNSIPGQTIITSAFIDDIFSLVMLVIMVNIAKGDVTAGSILIPLVSSFALVGFGAAASIKVMPKLKTYIDRVKESRGASIQPRDEVHITLMAIFFVFFGWVGSIIGSHLLGTFVAGMLFTKVPRSGLVWERQTKRVVTWMMRLFFSSSIAFSIPVSVMFTVEAFWKGLILAIVPCIGGKLLSGIFSGNMKWLVGWAMVARGEFAYLVAQTAKDEVCKSCDDPQSMLLSKKGYSSLVWALLWSTVMAPLCFKYVLTLFMSNRGRLTRSASIGGGLKSQVGQRFIMNIVGQHHSGILHEVMTVLHACSLDVLEARAESDGLIDVDKFVVVPRMGGDFDDEKLHEIAARVKEAINDNESQVVFEPVNLDADLEAVGVLQIRMIGDHHPDILHEVFDLLAEHKLDVLRAIMDEHTAMEKLKRAKNKNKDADEGQSRGRSETFGAGESESSKEQSNSDKGLTESDKKPLNLEHGYGASKLKESETIYARSQHDPETGVRPPISSVLRATLREKIHALVLSHGCHGETMIRMVPEEEAHETVHPITAIEADDEVSIITTHGKHHPEIIHKILDALAEMDLDVLHADVTQHDSGEEEDHSVFYIRNIDADAEKSATHQMRRKEIRDKLTEIYSEHELDGHASVRPLQGDRPAALSTKLGAGDATDDDDYDHDDDRNMVDIDGVGAEMVQLTHAQV